MYCCYCYCCSFWSTVPLDVPPYVPSTNQVPLLNRMVQALPKKSHSRTSPHHIVNPFTTRSIRNRTPLATVKMHSSPSRRTLSCRRSTVLGFIEPLDAPESSSASHSHPATLTLNIAIVPVPDKIPLTRESAPSSRHHCNSLLCPS